jgi:drug/metabolite transporter (DMT)-like permease
MQAVLAKITSESMLSIYPSFVKHSELSIPLQLWTRFFAYSAISLFFIDYTFVWKSLFQPVGLMIAATTLFHVWVSYAGFEVLDSGVGYSLFYCYPLLILLFSGYRVPWLTLLVVVGCFMLAWQSGIFGVGMILFAAVTEVLIYFMVKNVKSENPWNALFLSYFLGFMVLTIHQWKNLKPETLLPSIGVNTILGLFGYVLMFYSITRLTPLTYSFLSMTGIFMSFVYGYVYGEIPSWVQVVGASLIALAVGFSKKA